MNKYFYRLITKGKKTKVLIAGTLHDVKYEVPFYSSVKHVYAKTEDEARDIIYNKLKSKWNGFLLLHN